MSKKQKKKKKSVLKEKVHKHRWKKEMSDCALCGGGEYKECACGEIKEII